MELEKGKIYKAIFNDKVVGIEVLKKNKKSYSIKLDGEKETLWFDDNLELTIKTDVYSCRRTRTVYESVKIVSEKEAIKFSLERNLKYTKRKIEKFQEDIDLKQKELEKLMSSQNLFKKCAAECEKKLKELEEE